MKEKTDTESELEALKAKTLEKMWLDELDQLEKQYTIYKAKRVEIQAGGKGTGKGKPSEKKVNKLVPKK
jgi:hypothetical protein